MADKKSNTMELDAILAESRTRRTGSPAPSGARSGAAPRKAARPAAPAPQRNLNDDFIVVDDGSADAPRQSGPARRAPRPDYDYDAPGPKKKKKTGLIVALCIIGIILVAALGAFALYMFSGSGTGPDSTFSDNVYVNGKSLKDLTMEEAKTLMKTVENDLASGIKVEVKAGDKSYNYTKDDFKYTFDTEAVLNEAKQYSEEKGIKTEDKNYEIKMTVDDSTCKDLITKIAADIKTDAKDAKVTDFDPDAESMFTITAESKGKTLDETTSLNALSTFIKNGNIAGTVDATVKEVDPEYTADFLKKNITKLSEFSTTSTNNSNGNENMRVSLAACNGSIIEPGETWSFNDHTGNSNLESNGYKPAGVIVEGRSETGVGGGICQSSTTIYNAAILCGMSVVERECHYYKSVYVDAGRDATVDYGNIDLKVNNPFKYQLFMKCWMDGTQLHCEIYGLQNPKFDDIEINTSSPSYFGNGYKVTTTRTYLKDGNEVDSDDLPSSTYYTSAPSSGSSGNSGGGSGNSGGDSGSDDNSGGGEEAPAQEAPAQEAPAQEAPAQEQPAANSGGEGGQ
ncbi:VanW family protein [Ruminococcus sp.]|uniref:VanW family protein n=1 Tax=Ruminococcus sp. TaxID=41978 RepID=UPI0038685CBA